MDELKLMKSADQFFANNFYPPGSGRVTEITEFGNIKPSVLRRIPTWYRNLITRYPIVDLEIGIPNDHGDEALKGLPFEDLPLMGITFVSVKEIENDILNFFPGHILIEEGYIKIAEDKFVTQEGIYINCDESDPSIKLVFHDIGENAVEIIDNSEKILDHFSDIFKYGKRRFTGN